MDVSDFDELLDLEEHIYTNASVQEQLHFCRLGLRGLQLPTLGALEVESKDDWFVERRQREQLDPELLERLPPPCWPIEQLVSEALSSEKLARPKPVSA